MFLELDVYVYSSFDLSSTTGFKFNSLRASLLTVLRVVYAIVFVACLVFRVLLGFLRGCWLFFVLRGFSLALRCLCYRRPTRQSKVVDSGCVGLHRIFFTHNPRICLIFFALLHVMQDEAGEKARRVCKRGRPYCSGSNFGALWRAWTRPRLGGLPHLESFTWQNATPADRVTLPGRPGNPPRRVTPPIM